MGGVGEGKEEVAADGVVGVGGGVGGVWGVLLGAGHIGRHYAGVHAGDGAFGAAGFVVF